MAEPTGFFTDEQGRKRPITPSEGAQFVEPQMQMQQQTGLAYRSHEADPNHQSQFRNIWGFYEKVGHLALKHATYGQDERMQELLDVPEDKLSNLHDRLHHTSEGILSTEERGLVERIRQPMQLVPQAEDTRSGRLIRPSVPEFGPVIGRQYTTPTPPPFVGPTGKRLTMADVKYTMARSARIRELVEQGMSLEDAAVQASSELQQ